MRPYYGHHGMKQFIRGKPIRYAFKIWCLVRPDGFLVKFYPYTGAGNKIAGKILGSSVTEKLCLKCVSIGLYVHMDNYFTSLPSNNDLFCVGTIRNDRTEKVPLQDISKAARCTCCAVEDKENGITLLRWHDKNQVNLVTNLKDEKIFDIGRCGRGKKSERNRVSVPRPNIVKLYNKQMGGVDLFDKLRGHYRIRIRSRKWYWPLFRFGLNESIVNLWILFRCIQRNISLLEFTR
ncbi:Hypothetical predicted protein [Octopus vulgaris]|uniref:PiggyBac transposable element-derived protein domain-containing protein n=1 Tax=Octopus vulgaris TaxID=6645 RepID=A0AA36BH20_OCTVU|nr:Hypothetical predicted protein [Octopus vulgaris]